ncbi:MAG: Rne/Rng family ribonuclease [Acidobacteriia bacterium]|nr:Rne/Rng family ribonuclease [Terriglobia bacterium]
MSKELVVSANRHETRVAIVEDDQVTEVYHQRENEYSLAGSIHKGRVTRVLPGMQSAFVDIGLDRDAFLYVSDFFEDNEEYDKIVTSVEEKVLKLDRVAPAGAAAAPAEEPARPEAKAAEPEPEPEKAPFFEPPAVAAPAAPAAGGAYSDQQRRDDQDRRGRRSRRRRGGKGGGRGLPESKFYSPGARGGPSPAEHAAGARDLPERARSEALEPEREEPETAPPAADEFFVLPGESLAKHSSGAGSRYSPAEEAPEPEEEPDLVMESAPPAEPSAEAPVTAATFEAEHVPDLPEDVSAIAAEPASEPQPELAAALEVAEEEAEPAETVEDVDVVPADAAEREGGVEEGETPEASEANAQDEGPEPARIPTSLTATLREQGGRYLHRVSRRMRRNKGREGRPDGADAPRPPRHETHPPEPGWKAAAGVPEQRIAPPVPKAAGATDGRPEKAPASISDLLKEGQEIIVQIAKEPLGQKGARITSHIALPGRFLVYMPTVDHIGVSRKIPSDDERLRLKRILQAHHSGISGGFIVRTAGEGRSEEELRADMMFLYNMWLDMRQKAERRPAPLLIHHDLNVVERILRDQLTSAFKTIWVDNEEIYESVLGFVQRFQPALVNRVRMYTRANPIFDEFGITAELEKALRPKVWLKSGGYIVINQTEALVAIDVNTGKFVGKSNRLEDTIVKTNTDAIKEIVRQIRLRDLGGIIVVDFIDMDERKNRQKVMQALEESMRADRAPYKILQFNDFGLVAITRKRVKQSLERALCTPCPYCEGAGYVKSALTVVGEILQEAHKIARAVEGKDVLLRVAPEVAKLLKSNQNTYLQELEEILRRTVIVKSDPQLQQEKFDLA